ncbi:MAG TPA: LacI family DNA-binding transcriptional regulator [Rhizomicrobium sp.]
MKRFNKKSAGPITLRHIAEGAGVSIGTASRVINGRTNVDPAIRDRVDAVIAKLGYRPNALAQGMRRGATRTVGVIVRDISAPGLASFLRSVQEELLASGYFLLLANSGDRPAQEIALLQMFGDRKIDGLIMTVASETDRAALKARTRCGVPIVLLDREPRAGEDAVLVRHGDGMQQAVAYLAALGHKRIALITGRPDVYSARERLKGFEQGLKAAGLTMHPELVRAVGFLAESARLEASALMGLRHRPTAIVAGGAALLGSILEAVRGLGMDVPGDVSIVGAAETELAALTTPPVTIVKWNYAELGRIAANMLLGRMTGERADPSRRITLPAEFVIRGSCAPQS